MKEINKLTPEFFFESVAKKSGVSVNEVRILYNHYINRVKQCLRTDKKVRVTGLGTFELHPLKMLGKLYRFGEYLDRHPDYFRDIIWEQHDIWYREVAGYYKQLLTLKPKYEYIDGSLEKLRQHSRRIEELIDNEGNRRRSFETTHERLLPMSVQFKQQGELQNTEVG